MFNKGGVTPMQRNMPGWIGFLLLSILMAMTIAGCGGGGGGGGGDGGGSPTYTLSGTISAPSGIAIDGDVNDPNEDYAPNDTIATAQLINNPISVAGYVNVAGSGPAGRSRDAGDRDDYFEVSLNSGDRIALMIGDTSTGDLDLYLYDASGIEIAASKGTGSSESLTVGASGAYIVNVHAISGFSNYVLTIGPDTGAPAQDEALSTQHDFVPGQAIVRFVETAHAMGSMRALSDQAEMLGMRLEAGGPDRAVLLTFDARHDTNDLYRSLGADNGQRQLGSRANAELQRKIETLQAIKALRQRSDVISAEPNYILKHYATPNDTHYGLQWHYPMINLPQAWDITTGTPDSGNANVVVAVVDTGVLMNHPDLAGQLTNDGYDFILDPNISGDGTGGIDPDPNDPGDRVSDASTSSFHGTHCAGTVAAASNNARGVAGVSWGARIMPIRVLGKGGGTLYDILQGVLYAAGEPNDSGTVPTQPADIISMSFGGGGYSQAVQDIFTRVRNKGIILIAAAGNASTSTPAYPASYAGVISVSALNINAQLASYSNYGQYIDVAAPGGDAGDLDGDGYADKVWSTCGSDATGTIVYNYTAYNGTSMATPHVAGVVALMKALNPGLTPGQLDAHLQNGRITNDLGAPGWDPYYGWGMINAHKAVLVAGDDTISTPPLAVTPNPLNLGSTINSATLTVSKSVEGDFAVVGFTANATWLSVSEENIDVDGFGTYSVAVDRSSLAAGTHSAIITFTDSDSGQVNVTVVLQKVTASADADAGFHYVLLMNADTYEIIQQKNVAAVNGAYPYAFTGVPGGNYWIFAGSDRDNDSYVDNGGESFGAYYSVEDLATVIADRNRSGLDFTSDLRLYLPAASSFDAGTPHLPVLQRLR